MQYLWIFATGAMAFMTGRNLIAWAIGAYFFSWVALLAVIFLPARQEAMERRTAKIKLITARKLTQKESVIVKKEMKDFNTVDDLFKQLENK